VPNMPTLLNIRMRPLGIEEANPKSEVRNPKLQVSPNPFRNRTIIRYTIHDTRYRIQDASLKIYDVSGRMVKSFNLESCIMYHESVIFWDGTDDSGRKLPTGVYFIRLEGDEIRKTKKVILLN